MVQAQFVKTLVLNLQTTVDSRYLLVRRSNVLEFANGGTQLRASIIEIRTQPER